MMPGETCQRRSTHDEHKSLLISLKAKQNSGPMEQRALIDANQLASTDRQSWCRSPGLGNHPRQVPSHDRLSCDQPINAAQSADSMWFSLSACARLFGQRHSNSGSTCLRGRCVAQMPSESDGAIYRLPEARI